MVTDKQIRRLYQLIEKEKSLSMAASKAGIDEKTARKYLRSGKLPSESRPVHHWRTRSDPFAEVWEEVRAKLELNPGLEAKTLFEDLQRRYEGRFQDGQLRTLQRKVKHWRATEGPPKEVFFPQQHYPGVLCQSDFTHLTKLGVTIAGEPFPHLLYHFVLTYSNWETGTICFSESFESLSEGLQNALWELGAVARQHRTDRMSAAVHRDLNPEVFTERYSGLLRHYGIRGERTRAASPHENGDVEQRHHRFKRALDQQLMLRGSRDFARRIDYEAFLRRLFKQLNAGRRQRLAEERAHLRALPACRRDASKRMQTKVGASSTSRVKGAVYSVDSRLIGERIELRMHTDRIELYYGGRRVDTLPRLRGGKRHHIAYRHIIDWLVRKPGAFENYRFRQDLFPTHRFRMAYDAIKARLHGKSSKEYLRILHLAARENESAVDAAIKMLFDNGDPITAANVEALVKSGEAFPVIRSVHIAPVELSAYDQLLEERP